MALPKKKARPPAQKAPPAPSTPLGRRLRRAIALGVRGFPLLFSICVAMRLPPYALRILYIVLFPDAESEPGMGSLAAAFFVLGFEVISFLVGAVALVIAVSDLEEGRPASFVGAFRGAVERLGATVKTAALGAAYTGVGFLMLLIPGLIFLYQFSFAVMGVAVENLAGKSALVYSRDLVKRYPKRVLANLAVVCAVALFVYLAVQGPLNLMLGFVLGLFDLSEESAFVQIGFDVARRVAAQAAPVFAASYWWVVYAELSDKPEVRPDGDEPELITL
jgi:hypothetical protein